MKNTYNLDLNGSTSKPMSQMDNYSRNDSGLGPNGQNKGITQENIRQDVNGSTDKPFPQERNWVQNNDPDGMLVRSRVETGVVNTPATQPFGQAKYAVRGLGPSIYQDKTRYTADDWAASKVSDQGCPASDNFPVSMEETQEGYGG